MTTPTSKPALLIEALELGRAKEILNLAFDLNQLTLLPENRVMVAKLDQAHTGICVVDGDFGRTHYRQAVAECLAAGLNPSELFVYACTASYLGDGIRFSKISELAAHRAAQNRAMLKRQSTAKELLDHIHLKGYELTLEVHGTSSKWVTGRNLFLGLRDPRGLDVRGPYGKVELELPLRLTNSLLWQPAGHSHATTAQEALIHSLKANKVRKNSLLYAAVANLAQLCK